MVKQPINNLSDAEPKLSDVQIAAIEHILRTKSLLELLKTTRHSRRRDPILLLSPYDEAGFAFDLDFWGAEGFVADEGLKDPEGVYKKVVLSIKFWFHVLGTPPVETFLHDDDGDRVAQEIAQFCRARHQVIYMCPGCGRRARYAVSWTAEGGNVYPEPRECAYICEAEEPLERFAEAYIEEMPYPFNFDPEPERSRSQKDRHMVNPLTAYKLHRETPKAASAAA